MFPSLRRLAQRRVAEVTAANRARIADTELMDARGQLQSARADLLQTSEDLAQARTLAARDSRAAGSVPEGRVISRATLCLGIRFCGAACLDRVTSCARLRELVLG